MVCKPYQTQTFKFYRTYKPRISKTSRPKTERLEDVKIPIFSNFKDELNVFPVKVSTEFLFGKINVQEKLGGWEMKPLTSGVRCIMGKNGTQRHKRFSICEHTEQKGKTKEHHKASHTPTYTQ